MANRTVVILGGSSDIGRGLVERYLAAGDRVVATYRRPGSLACFEGTPGVDVLPLDLEKPEQFSTLGDFLRSRKMNWDVFIAANGTMEPIGAFLQLDGAEWQQSICVNALSPCRVLQELYALRRPGTVSHVAFFAGGGTNNPFTNYSAYCLSKIILIKMCELIDDECPDLNAFIVGPGYVRTKIHEQTLKDPEAAGANYGKTMDFLSTPGTSIDEIFECIEWCAGQGRAVVGGRNISVVHDRWRDGGEDLAAELRDSPDKYKLRRHGNA